MGARETIAVVLAGSCCCGGLAATAFAAGGGPPPPLEGPSRAVNELEPCGDDTNGGDAADFDCDGSVGTTDLLVLLNSWGEC